MMPTNEERREIANKLHAIDRENFASSYSEEFEKIEKIIGIWEDYDKFIWHVIADLIEPEPESTCHYEPEIKDYDYDDEGNEVEVDAPAENCDYFECSECGFLMLYDGNDRFGGGWFDTEPPYSPRFKYCPNCGAKVVDE